jgi:hypothetical protein
MSDQFEGNDPEVQILEVPIEGIGCRGAVEAFIDSSRSSVALYALLACIMGGMLARFFGNGALTSAFDYGSVAIATFGVAFCLLTAARKFWVRRRAKSELHCGKRARVLWLGFPTDLSVCRDMLSDCSHFPLEIPYSFLYMGLPPRYSLAVLLALCVFFFSLGIMAGLSVSDAKALSLGVLIVVSFLIHTLIPGSMSLSRGRLDIVLRSRLTGRILTSKSVSLDTAEVRVEAIAPSVVRVSSTSNGRRQLALYNLPYPVCWCIFAASLRTVQTGRVAQGGHPPRAPTDPYVRR